MTQCRDRGGFKLDLLGKGTACRIFLCSLTLLVLSSLCSAQKSTGDILGTVTDSSGAALSGVPITAINIGTHDARKAATDQLGNYRFPFLAPGTYSLRAESQGFKTVTIENVILTVNEAHRQDFALQVGTVQQEVTVTANPVAVNAETATLGGVIEEQRVVALPLNGRAFLQLATLLPGATDVDVPNTEDNGYLVAQRPGVSVSFAGIRSGSNEILFDGITSKDNYENNLGLSPPPDSIAEFKVLQGYFSPEYALPAVINVVTKSGTNNYHVSLWEFLRNDVLNARNYFETAGLPKGTLRQNQFGFAGGGPFVKNKLFFFGDYEGLRIRASSGSSFATVPTPAELTGDFSALLPTPIFDPATYNPSTGTRQPFLGNIIPPVRISSFAKAYSQYIPKPVPGVLAPFNFVGTSRTINNSSKFDIRIDWIASAKDTVFGRFSWSDSTLNNESPLPYAGSEIPLNVRNTSIGWTHTFSRRLVNEVFFGIDNVIVENSAPLNGASNPNFGKVLGIQNLNSTPKCNALADVNMAGYTPLGGLNSCEIPQNNDPIYGDNASYQLGRHFLTFGGQIRQIRETDIVSFSTIGTFAFTGQYSGNGAADFVLGAVNNAQGGQWTGPMHRRAWWPDLYFNDDFKVTRNLTLNYGIRWQYTQPWTEVNNKIEQIGPGGILQVAGQNGVSRGLITPHKRDFAPRLGLAWAPFGSTTWAVRSSFGIFYDRMPGNEWAWQGISVPFLIATGAISDPNVPTIDLSTLFPSVTATDPNAIVAELAAAGTPASMFNLQDFKDPYIQQWTLSVEHSLPWGVFTQAAYVGSKGTHLSKRFDQNVAPLPAPSDTRPLQERVPFPQYGFILNDNSVGNSYYHGLHLTVRKAYSKGLVFQGAYTYSKCVDFDSYDQKATRNYYLANLDKGRCIMDARQRFVYSMVYDLPFGKNLTGVAKQTLSGWQFNTILALQTGLPLSLFTEADPSNTGAIFAPRPTGLCDGNLPASQRTPTRWFNTSCYVLPAPDTYGNTPAQNIDGPPNKVVNLALNKTFRLAEWANLEFRAETFNFFNHPNFGRPNPDVQSASFGQISSAGPGRVYQFGLKLLF